MQPIISIAPMLDYTDFAYRQLVRLFAPHLQVYTEMITVQALHHGDRKQLLARLPEERDVVLQLGGSDPQLLAPAAKWIEQAGFAAINLNVGCPSSRVQSGRFGACLMREPELVSQCIAAMRDNCQLPVTVKTRIGIDEDDSWQFVCDFIEPVAAAGCDTFILHARKAWLQGLSPKQNREVPPLNYQRVYDIKARYPELQIHLNGGVDNVAAVREVLAPNDGVQLDGVMVGRAAYHNPQLLVDIEREFYHHDAPDFGQVIMDYCRWLLSLDRPLSQKLYMARHLIPIRHGQPGARAWRRLLSEEARKVANFGELVGKIETATPSP